MKTTIDFLDAIKARFGGLSDYAAAKKIGVTRSAVSCYRNKKSSFDVLTAVRVAELLEIDPAIVVTSAHAERARTPEERATWESITRRLERDYIQHQQCKLHANAANIYYVNKHACAAGFCFCCDFHHPDDSPLKHDVFYSWQHSPLCHSPAHIQ